MKKRKITIYSDISYFDYQHVNQMLFRFLSKNKDNDVVFLQRFVMNGIKSSYFFRFLKRFFHSCVNFFIINESGVKSLKIDNNSIRNVVNVPPQNLILDYINKLLIFFQRRNIPLNGTVITFLPSKALESTFNKYDDIVYYCVHDSEMQSYHRRNIDFERILVEKSKFVFCDNIDVLKKLSGSNEIQSIIDNKKSDTKFYLVPPPVPREFYKKVNVIKEYDFVYFGSIHKDIDIDFLNKLSLSNNLLVISYQMFNLIPGAKVTFTQGTSDLSLLVSCLHKARAIILPYTNSAFMDTISPAKLNQSIATGLPVYCTNKKLTREYNLNFIDEELISTIDLNDSSRECKNEYDINLFNEDYILGKIANIIENK